MPSVCYKKPGTPLQSPLIFQFPLLFGSFTLPLQVFTYRYRENCDPSSKPSPSTSSDMPRVLERDHPAVSIDGTQYTCIHTYPAPEENPAPKENPPLVSSYNDYSAAFLHSIIRSTAECLRFNHTVLTDIVKTNHPSTIGVDSVYDLKQCNYKLHKEIYGVLSRMHAHLREMDAVAEQMNSRVVQGREDQSHPTEKGHQNEWVGTDIGSIKLALDRFRSTTDSLEDDLPAYTNTVDSKKSTQDIHKFNKRMYEEISNNLMCMQRQRTQLFEKISDEEEKYRRIVEESKSWSSMLKRASNMVSGSIESMARGSRSSYQPPSDRASSAQK